eukprot:6476894-Amphidinium_carterae.1
MLHSVLEWHHLLHRHNPSPQSRARMTHAHGQCCPKEHTYDAKPQLGRGVQGFQGQSLQARMQDQPLETWQPCGSATLKI